MILRPSLHLRQRFAAASLAIILMLLSFAMASPIQAADSVPPSQSSNTEPASVEVTDNKPPPPRSRNSLSLGASLRSPGIPFLKAGLHVDNVTFAFEYIKAQHELFELNAESNLTLALAQYRLPIAWHDWVPTADAGLAMVRSDAGGVTMNASGFTAALGVERPFGSDNNWALRGEFRTLRLMDETHWLGGVGFEYRFRLPDAPGSGRGVSSGAGSRTRNSRGTVAAVEAAGRITGTSLSMSVSGDWSFYVDPVKGTASFDASGRSDDGVGSIGFSDAIAVYADSTSVSATFVDREEHEGKPVRITVNVSASPDGLSADISARRSDGVSMSASLYGTTSRFVITPLPDGEGD